MSTSTSDRGVSIGRNPAGNVQVSIEIANGSDPNDEQAILSQAWTQLGEAIARHKAAMEADTTAQSGAGEHPDGTKAVPGSGAWWSE